MSKIFQLKKWLTLEDGARYLSTALQEDVSVADVLQLAIEGNLVVSANFVNHAQARPGRRLSLQEAGIWLVPDFQSPPSDEIKAHIAAYPRHASRAEQHEWLTINRTVSDSPSVHLVFRGDRISEEDVLEWESDTIVSIKGLWDLPTFGGARLDLEHALQSLVGGPEITLTCLDGTVVVSPDGTRYSMLLDRFETNSAGEKYAYNDPNSYYPRGGLPEDAPIVVRSEAIASFLASLAMGDAPKADVSARERSGLLKLIAGLAEEAKVDLNSDKATAQLVAAAAPFDGPTEKTVRKHLKAIREEILPGRAR